MHNIVDGLRESITDAAAKISSLGKDPVPASDEIEQKILRAEGLLCVAMHPMAPKVPLPTAPPSSTSSNDAWAEPGL